MNLLFNYNLGPLVNLLLTLSQTLSLTDTLSILLLYSTLLGIIMGVTKETLTPGNGTDTPRPGTNVAIHYTGALFDPSQKDNMGFQYDATATSNSKDSNEADAND